MEETTTSVWKRVLDDPHLGNLPYKVETTASGQIILSPHTPKHSLQQGRIVQLFYQHETEAGEAAVEFAVDTPQGVKVPDVVWLTSDEAQRLPDDAEVCPFAPAICVEVLSRSNTADEITEKRDLYFALGAREVWTCAPSGTITFYAAGEPQPLDHSPLMPGCPSHLRRSNGE